MNWGITELRHPYINWHYKQTRELFLNAISVRKLGYDHNYKQLMSVGTLDFLSDHYLIWKEINKKKVYVSAMRSTTKDVTDFYSLSFPCEDLINSIGRKHNITRQLCTYEQLLMEHGGNAEKVRYFSGWTTLPEQRTKDMIGKTIQLAAVSTMAFSHREYLSRISIASAMPHVKTDKMFFDMGYKVWEYQGHPLDALPSPNYNDFPTLLMVCTDVCEQYLENNRFIKKKWDEREIVGTHLYEHLQKKAA